MDSPVDKHPAARLRFVGKRAAEPRYRAVTAERAVNVIYPSEIAAAVHFFKHFDGFVIAVAHADVEELSLFFRFLCHFAGEVVVYRYRLFAENVLPGFKGIHCNGVMRIVRCEDPDSLHLRVVKGGLIIGYRLFRAEAGNLVLCLFRDKVAGVLYTDIVHPRKRGEVRVV